MKTKKLTITITTQKNGAVSITKEVQGLNYLELLGLYEELSVEIKERARRNSAKDREVVGNKPPETPKKIYAPWTQDQARKLITRQESKGLHPYTCSNSCGGYILEVVEKGLICNGCNYRQDWAWEANAT